MNLRKAINRALAGEIAVASKKSLHNKTLKKFLPFLYVKDMGAFLILSSRSQKRDIGELIFKVITEGRTIVISTPLTIAENKKLKIYSPFHFRVTENEFGLLVLRPNFWRKKDGRKIYRPGFKKEKRKEAKMR